MLLELIGPARLVDLGGVKNMWNYGEPTLPRVDTVIDCDMFVNPERIRSQMEGAVIMGISLAKYGAITFKDGRVEQGNFDDYPVSRVDDAPVVTNVHIMPPRGG